MQRKMSVIAFGISFISVLGCADLFGPKEEIRTFDVASAYATCSWPPVGVEAACLQVRANSDEPWTVLYTSIEGFNYEPGFEYTLRVAVREIADPLPDAPGATYRLLEVLRKVAAAPA